MPIFLIVLIFISSSLDQCMIEEVSYHSGVIVVKTTGSDCESAPSTDEACESEDGTSQSKKHSSNDACQHCHGGHFATPNDLPIPTPTLVLIDQQNTYAFNHDSPSYSTLRRPPKT